MPEVRPSYFLPIDHDDRIDPISFLRSTKPIKTRLILALTVVAFVKFQPGYGAEALDFNRDVRPILSDACFACHGPDESNVKAGLRLDKREHALKPSKSGAVAIVPGKPEQSELIKRIFSPDEDDRMPPSDSHKVLSPDQREALKSWIAAGAVYEGHWAFTRPKRSAVPDLANVTKSWVRTPVDAFIGARLAQEGLSPSPEVSREVLIRRVSLDLTGLPPTLAEIDAFLADNSEDAYVKVVDRLLASPRFGEHFASSWLDAARYADSHGFQTDSSRFMWPWRDWVIAAFNQNMPFDRFTIEQLAGDLLPTPTTSQLVASGFNRNHRINGEGGIIPEEWRIETVMDRVESTTSTWMALTFNCARCHDHKYDPISQKEFYQFFAYFNDVDETGGLKPPGPVLPMPDREQQQELTRLEDLIRRADEMMAQAKSQMISAQLAWETSMQPYITTAPQAWVPLANDEVRSTGGAQFTRLNDGSWLASGTNPTNDTYEITAAITGDSISGLRLTAIADASLPAQGFGRGPKGAFVVTGIEAQVTAPSLNEPMAVHFIRVEASRQTKGWDLEAILRDPTEPSDGQELKLGWAGEGSDSKKQRHQLLLLCELLPLPRQAQIRIRIHQNGTSPEQNLGRFNLSVCNLPSGLAQLDGSGLPEAVKVALRKESANRTEQEREVIVRYFQQSVDNPVRRVEGEISRARKQRDDTLKRIPKMMIMKDLDHPRIVHVLKRGEYDKPGEQVQRGLPAFLPALPEGEPNNRLGLARWLVSGLHPLTARVWVNRAWEHLFGTGLVASSENFGSQAEYPSHLDLLDWLACEFVEPTVLPAVNGVAAHPWDMKAVIKLLVLSATYRQQTGVSPVLAEKDPGNRLLARGPRFRLSAEALRDQALALSGLLVERVGGASVRPYMPAGVWDETSKYGDLRNYKADTGDGLYRRSLYTIWKRTAAPPSMLLFDSPSREICTVKRSRTNTPLQALALLNELTYVEAARRLAERMLKEGGATADQRIAWAFRMVTARRPTAEEIKILSAGLDKRLERYRANPANAQALVSQGASKPSGNLKVEELAAYTATANILLNLDEVINRE